MSKSALVVGLGFAGSVLSRELAESGFDVLAIEKRNHIAGNMYECERSNGVRVHRYGPHIFHTNSQKVYEYLSHFSDFYPYTHRVLGRIEGKFVPIPFNFTSMDALFSAKHAENLKGRLTESFTGRNRVFVSDLLSHADPDIAELGAYVFEHVFVHYTAKQWGVPAEEVDTAVINRVPVILGTDDRYFSDKIQMMPDQGYTALFKKMLDHPRIHIELGADALSRLSLCPDSAEVLLDGARFSGPVCFSGALDELFGYRFGALPYRSLDMRFEDLPVDYYQPAAVVNYPNEENFTRITEFKHMTHQKIQGNTTILKEYPLPYRPGGAFPPYYPIAGSANQELYDAYLRMCGLFPNLYLCGRLAEYRYYNMDAVVERALLVSERIAADNK